MADITAEAGRQAGGIGWAGRRSAGAEPADLGTADHLMQECDAMVRYALGQGLRILPELASAMVMLEDRGGLMGATPTLPEIVNLHSRLGELVSPARPHTILLLQQDRKHFPFLNNFGPLPNIRRLMVMAFIATSGFVTLSLSPYITTDSMVKAVYAMQGIELLTVMLFLMSAAALGACFNALFTAHHYISDGTYDTRFDSSYWMRIGLGVISGLLMAELIPVDELLRADEHAQTKAVDLGKPMLALLGGFSANMVYTVLQRVVQTFQSLFQPDPAQAKDAAERDMRSRIDQQVARSRMDSAGALVALQDAIAKDADKDQLAAIVSRALDTLVPGSGAAQERIAENMQE